VSPATVATSTTYTAVGRGTQRKGFYAAGLFWAFYSNGANAGWEFSNDGITWDGAFTPIGACIHGPRFSVWFDGTYVHYVRYNYFSIFYRRGIPEDDGSINWSAVEQTVNEGSISDYYDYPYISIDSNGYAWIGAPRTISFVCTPYILKNANNDGTWTTDFATELSAIEATIWLISPVPLTDGKVYVIYCRHHELPLGKLYDGGFGGEENNLADYDIEIGQHFSAVADGDDVHFTYNKDRKNQIRHNERVWGVGWNVNDVLVQDNVEEFCGPALSIDTVNDELYCFWTDIGTDHVYYKKYSSGSWDVDPTDWIDESTDAIRRDDLISSYYQDYGGDIGLLYSTKEGSPYNVKFDYLTLVAGAGWTGKRSGMTNPAEIDGVPVTNIAKVMGVA